MAGYYSSERSRDCSEGPPRHRLKIDTWSAQGTTECVISCSRHRQGNNRGTVHRPEQMHRTHQKREDALDAWPHADKSLGSRDCGLLWER